MVDNGRGVNGWWLASDGRWYPPEQRPSVVLPPEPPDPPPAEHLWAELAGDGGA